ncbi:MAG: enolase C-terminal domain-like protein [Pirellulaceae bacterium]|jgi:muconate cycloisomerase|nr:enolase C-terminal domain-like protein [Pirellulaceae bacterium]MDP7016886.1 enolase C-terminal domain-like protein [Pirellulaceae bacterium]
MKISRVESLPVRIPLKPEFHMKSALGQHQVSDYVLIRITTDDGIEGAGEATVMVRWSGETVWGAHALAERVIGPAIIGDDPRDIDGALAKMNRIAAKNWFIKSAIEMALWDIVGKAEGKPVYDLLGGPVRSRDIRGRFSMGAYEVERASRRAKELVSWGFTTIKVKVGGKPADDIARVTAVREAIGPDLELVIDANCGWDADTAIHCIHALEDCRLGLVEQPTTNGDYAALARVRRETNVPVMADDICFDYVDAEELIRNDCCDVISLYPGKNGGIAVSKRIAEFAGRHGVACSIGSNLEWDVATAAMGHLIVAVENMKIETYPGDIYGPVYHETRIVLEPLKIAGPITTISDRPGLGVEVDWELAQSLRCPDC